MVRKAIIFDMDGLMIDSERVTYQGYVKECEKLGFTMTKEFYVSLLGLTQTSISGKFDQEFGVDFPFQEVIKRVHIYVEQTFETQGVPIKAGLVELLEYLKKQGCKTIVATSSNRARVDKILACANITKYFQDTICGDEVENGKPNPEIFLKACEKLGVHPSEAYVLEDSEMGIMAAYSAGIGCLCIPDMKYPDEQFASKTVCILDSLVEALDFLKKERV